jgi:hypothetical protein
LEERGLQGVLLGLGTEAYSDCRIARDVQLVRDNVSDNVSICSAIQGQSLGKRRRIAIDAAVTSGRGSRVAIVKIQAANKAKRTCGTPRRLSRGLDVTIVEEQDPSLIALGSQRVSIWPSTGRKKHVPSQCHGRGWVRHARRWNWDSVCGVLAIENRRISRVYHYCH